MGKLAGAGLLAHRERIKGIRSTQRLLRALPDAARREIGDMLAEAAPKLLADMRAKAPVRTGALRAALSARVMRTSLKLRVGLLGKRTNVKFYYGHILELGSKGKTVTIKRGPRTGAAMRIPARAARPFVFTANQAVRGPLRYGLNRFWDRTLTDASAGGGGDD